MIIRKIVLSALSIILIFVSISLAQEMSVPVDIQYSLFAKIIQFDRNLKKRIKNDIIIGIIYQSKFRKSFNVKNELEKEFDKSNIKKIADILVRFIPIDIQEIDLSDISDFKIDDFKIDVLYVTPLRAVEINKITSISRTKKIITLTGVPEYCKAGLSVSIGQKSQKPQIIINLSAAKAEGINFSSQLLKLAKIIK